MNPSRTALLLLLAIAAAFPLAALEGRIIVTAAVNVPDQFAHILPRRAPTLPRLDQAVYGQPVRCHILLTKPALKEGRAAVQGDFTLTDPNGKTISLGRDLQLLAGRCTTGVFLSPCSVVIIAEPGDPAGEYIVKGEIRDLNDGSRITVSSPVFHVKEANYPDRALTRSEISRLITFYYRDPKPHLVPAAFRSFLQWPEPVEVKGRKREDRRNFLAAFAELYRLNPQLWDTLPAEALRLTRPDQHRNFAIVINAIGSDFEEKLRPRLPKQTLDELDQVTARNPLLFQRVTKPWQLDVLWARFFVTGQPGPLRLLVRELGRKNLLTPVEAREFNHGKLNPEKTAGFINYLIVAAVDWSIGANMGIHPLVRFYLEADLARGKITDPTAKLVVQRHLLRVERQEAAAARKKQLPKTPASAPPKPSDTPIRKTPDEEKK